MVQKKFLVGLAAMALVFGLAVLGCDSSGDDSSDDSSGNSLVGSWTKSGMTLTFTATGWTLSVGSKSGTYTLNGTALTLSDGSEEMNATVAFGNSTVTFSGLTGNAAILNGEWTRSGGGGGGTPTTAAELATALGGTGKATASGSTVTLAANVTVPAGGTTIPAGVALDTNSYTLTVPASTTLTVAGTLTVSGTLTFTNATSKMVIHADGTLTAPAAGSFNAKSRINGAYGIKLSVYTASDTALATPTGFTSAHVTAPAPVVLTTAAAANGTGDSYIIGNASFDVNGCTTAHDATAVTCFSIANDIQRTAGSIQAGTGTTIVLVGKN